MKITTSDYLGAITIHVSDDSASILGPVGGTSIIGRVSKDIRRVYDEHTSMGGIAFKKWRGHGRGEAIRRVLAGYLERGEIQAYDIPG